MSVQVSYKKQTALVLIIFLIVFVIIEISATLFVINITECAFKNSEVFENIDTILLNTICDDYLSLERTYNEYFQLKPNQNFETISINQYSLRGDDFTFEKSDDVYRIIMIGGSTIFGVGSTSNESTIPGYLQKNLNEFSLPYSIQVINAGYPGANSHSESKFVKDILLQFQPDMIVVYDGWNELQQPAEMLQQTNTNMISLFLRDLRVSFPFYNTPVLISEIGANIISSVSNNDSNLFDEKLEFEKVSWWKSNWDDVCELANEQDFEMVISIQPIIGIGNKPLTDQESLILDSDPLFIKHANYMSNLVSEMYDMEHCLHTYDLSHSFDDVSEPIYFDQGHMSDNGNLIIANKFTEILHPLLKN